MNDISQEGQEKEAQPEAAKTVEKGAEKKEYPIDTEVSPLIPETKSMVERAENASERLAKLIEEERKLVARNEALVARMMLSGKAEAGSLFKTPEQTEKEKMDAEISKTINRFK